MITAFLTDMLGTLTLALALGCTSTSTVGPPGATVENLSDLVQQADLIVIAKVVEVKPGRTVETQEEKLRFNDVTLEVEQVIKGKRTDSVTLEQLDPQGHPVSSEVGPPYQEGQRYGLFFRSGEGDRQVTLLQGRFLLEEGEVEPTQQGDVAQETEGMSEAQFIQEIQRLSSLP